MVACSPKVEYYKIHRSNFLQYFGGDKGEQVNQMRAQMILKNNWLHSKLSMIEMMVIDQRLKMEYCSEQDLNKFKPRCIPLEEVSFLKNDKILQDIK